MLLPGMLGAGLAWPSALAQDWPGWGGNDLGRNMYAPAKGLPDKFDPGKMKPGTEEVDLSTAKNVKWAAKLGSQSYGNVTIAGHAADGYARVTGRPGVCAVTAGPGVTDVVTAVANAQRAGIPMICIGGAGPKLLCDMGSLQDMDHVTLMRPITKWSVQVPETRRIPEYIDAAFRVAQSNVPGPVFLEMPLDLLMNFGDDAELAATRPLEEPPRHAGSCSMPCHADHERAVVAIISGPPRLAVSHQCGQVML